MKKIQKEKEELTESLETFKKELYEVNKNYVEKIEEYDYIITELKLKHKKEKKSLEEKLKNIRTRNRLLELEKYDMRIKEGYVKLKSNKSINISPSRSNSNLTVHSKKNNFSKQERNLNADESRDCLKKSSKNIDVHASGKVNRDNKKGKGKRLNRSCENIEGRDNIAQGADRINNRYDISENKSYDSMNADENFYQIDNDKSNKNRLKQNNLEKPTIRKKFANLIDSNMEMVLTKPIEDNNKATKEFEYKFNNKENKNEKEKNVKKNGYNSLSFYKKESSNLKPTKKSSRKSKSKNKFNVSSVSRSRMNNTEDEERVNISKIKTEKKGGEKPQLRTSSSKKKDIADNIEIIKKKVEELRKYYNTLNKKLNNANEENERENIKLRLEKVLKYVETESKKLAKYKEDLSELK